MLAVFPETGGEAVDEEARELESHALMSKGMMGAAFRSKEAAPGAAWRPAAEAAGRGRETR